MIPRIRMRTAFSVALAVAIASGCSGPTLTPQDYVRSGDELFNLGNYKDAVTAYQRAADASPRLGVAWYRMGEAFVRLNSFEEALPLYVRAADLLTNDVDAQLKAGSILLMRGRFEEARARAERAIELDPTSIDALVLRASADAGDGDLYRAIEATEQAIDIDPDNALPYVNLGLLRLSAGQLDLAEESLKRACELDEGVGSYLALANYYWTTDRPAETEAALLRVAELDPDSVRVNRALAFFYLSSNRAMEAEPFVVMLANDSSDSGMRIALADYYLGTQRPRSAMPILRDLVSRGIHASDAALRLAVAAYLSGQTAEAHDVIDAAIDSDASNLRELLVKVRLLIADGDLAEAKARIETVVAERPDATEAQYLLGLIYAKERDPARAISTLSRVLTQNPLAPGVPIELARLYLAEGDAASAAQFAQAAVQAQPGSLDARLTLGRTLIAAGDLGAAQATLAGLDDALARPEVSTQLGAIAMAQGDASGARRAFEEALSSDPSLDTALTGLVLLDLQEEASDRARSRVEASLEPQPRNPARILLKAQLLALERDFDEAADTLRGVIASDPMELRAYQMLGHVYLALGRLDAARREFDELARRSPAPTDAHTMVAMILERQGDLVGARDRYEKALDVDPRAVVAANNLAWLLAENDGSLDLALQHATTAHEVLPNDADVNDTLGWIYLKKGLHALALRYLERATELDSSDAWYHYHLGMAYASGEGNPQRARASLERALRIDPGFSAAADVRAALSAIEE